MKETGKIIIINGYLSETYSEIVINKMFKLDDNAKEVIR